MELTELNDAICAAFDGDAAELDRILEIVKRDDAAFNLDRSATMYSQTRRAA